MIDSSHPIFAQTARVQVNPKAFIYLYFLLGDEEEKELFEGVHVSIDLGDPSCSRYIDQSSLQTKSYMVVYNFSYMDGVFHFRS